MDSMIATSSLAVAEHAGVELILIWRGQELRLPADTDAIFSIGLHRDNDLAMPGTYVSRHHATLQWRRNRFELVDHSTNGTFIQLEDGQISHVHRVAVRLWGTGFLSCGEPITVDSAIKFRHA